MRASPWAASQAGSSLLGPPPGGGAACDEAAGPGVAAPQQGCALGLCWTQVTEGLVGGSHRFQEELELGWG